MIVISLQAEFFNNYLRDVDRPMPLEPTLSSSSALQSSGQTPGGGGTGEESPAGVTAPPWGQGGPIMIFGRGRLLLWIYRIARKFGRKFRFSDWQWHCLL